MRIEGFTRNVRRTAEAAECKCRGFAVKTKIKVKQSEVDKYDCGYSDGKTACCTAIFKCKRCGNTFVGRLYDVI